MEAESGCVRYVVVGVGINVNQLETDFPLSCGKSQGPCAKARAAPSVGQNSPRR